MKLVGLVEEAGGGTGRRSRGGRLPRPRRGTAASLAATVAAEQYFEQLMRWLEARPEEPPEWQEAAMLGDRILYLTAGSWPSWGVRRRS
jgi:hypothetical protein